MARPQKAARPNRGRANIQTQAPAMPVDASNVKSTPNIAYIRPEVVAMYPKWEKVKDCLRGELAIKEKGERYLPMPQVEDPADQRDRYRVYKERAVFYNATRRTNDGLMGEVFSRDPVRIMPPELKILMTDADGAGTALDQIAREALAYTMAYGRGGLFVDYPTVKGPVTRLQQLSGEIRPTIACIEPMNIINWRTIQRGAKRVLQKLVYIEQYVDGDDGFEVKFEEQYRVLSLVPGPDGGMIVQNELWRKEHDESGVLMGYFTYSIAFPLDGAGKNLDTIPFFFFGSNSNDEYCDEPPLYDLAVLNVGHYRNSADYEEACFIVGQPTAWFSGLTKEWVEDVFKAGKVYLGSRAIIPLPANAQAGLLQVTANSMPKEAMDQKEAQMASLGAKLVDKSGTQRTLGEAQIDETSASSILATAARNVSAALVNALQVAYQFATGTAYADETVVMYDLNTDFPSARLTPNERAELMLEWQAGAITWTEMRAGLRKAGIAYEDDSAAKTEGAQKLKDDAANKLASTPTPTFSAANGGTNQPKLNNGNGGGNQAGS